jgi:hypothetical protein
MAASLAPLGGLVIAVYMPLPRSRATVPLALSSVHPIVLAKIVVLGVALAMAPWQPTLDRLGYFLEIQHYPQGAVFIFVTVICLAAFIVTPFLKSSAIRVPLVALTFGSYAADAIFRSISGDYLDTNQVAMLWRERHMAAEAISVYFSAGLYAAVWLIPATLILAWQPAPPFAP